MKDNIDQLIDQIAKEKKQKPEVVRSHMEEAIDSLYDASGHAKNEQVMKLFGNQKPDVETFLKLLLSELRRRMAS